MPTKTNQRYTELLRAQGRIQPLESNTRKRFYSVEYESSFDGDTTFIEVPSVTTVLDMLSKPALPPWAFNLGVEVAHEFMGDPDAYPTPESLKAAIKAAERTQRDEAMKAAQRGIAVHGLIENIITGETSADIEELDPELIKRYMISYFAWEEAYQPTYELTEVKVASVEHRFAGRFDAIALIGAHPSSRRHEDLTGQRVIIDFKTNRDGRCYPESHLPQIEAYALGYRDTAGPDAPKIDQRIVVGIGEAVDGKPKFSTTVSYYLPETFIAIKNAYESIEYSKANK